MYDVRPHVGERMKFPEFVCLRCQTAAHIDFRYLHNGETYQLEMHCETHTGGCNFYRVLDLHFNELIGDL